MKYTLAVAQVDAILGNVKKNVSRHVDLARRAREGGAKLVVFLIKPDRIFPEGFNG